LLQVLADGRELNGHDEVVLTVPSPDKWKNWLVTIKQSSIAAKTKSALSLYELGLMQANGPAV